MTDTPRNKCIQRLKEVVKSDRHERRMLVWACKPETGGSGAFEATEAPTIRQEGE